MCDGSGVIVSFCEDCESFLCTYCSGAHGRMKIFSSHHTSSLSSPEFQHINPKPKPIACQIHPDCCVSFYCATCCQLICNDCVATEGVENTVPSTTVSDDSEVHKVVHRSHILYTLTENRLASLEGKVCQLLTSVGTQKEKLQKDIVSTEGMEKLLASHTEQLKKALVKQVEQHIKRLRERCEHDLKQVDKNHASALDNYRAKKSALKEKISNLTMKERFASKAQNCNGMVPKIAMIAKATSELERSEALSSRSSFSSFSDVWYFNELPLVVRDLSEEIKTGLTRRIEGSDFICESKPELGKKSQVTIKASVLPVGTPQFEVMYGNSERILKTTVQPTVDGTWVLECTPTCIGTHKIRV